MNMIFILESGLNHKIHNNDNYGEISSHQFNYNDFQTPNATTFKIMVKVDIKLILCSYFVLIFYRLPDNVLEIMTLLLVISSYM